MNKKLVIIFLILIFAAFSVGYFKWKIKNIQKFQLNDKTQKSDVIKLDSDNIEVSERRALELLPKEVLLYKLEKNGFNQDKSLYSVNSYISLGVEKGLKKAGIANTDFDKYIGCWIVNLQNNSAYRIATAIRQDYKFYRWVDNDKIELIGDGNNSATVYSALTGDIISKRKFNLNTGADISNWKIYKSEECRFEVRYPEDFIIKEVKENYSEKNENRYVSFYDSKKDVKIFLGVKNISEENVDPRPFRTGIGSEESLSRGTVVFGDGFANEKWLVSFKEGNISYIEEIWFCKDDNTADLSCDNIKLENQKEAFMGVTVGAKAEIREIQELLGGMIGSFKAL